MIRINPPFRQYLGLDGLPLDGGYIYFGLPNQNPETAPNAVYWDAAGTQPAVQPVRTSNGYLVHNGALSDLFSNGEYSITVRDRNGVLISYQPTMVDADVTAITSLASAATVAIGGAASKQITITGVATVNAFDIIAAGTVRDVTAAGAFPITHNATSMILLGGVSRTYGVGDCSTFLSLGGGNWRETKYQSAAGIFTGTSFIGGTFTGSRFIPTGSTVPANGMFLSAANQLSFATNTTERLRVDSTGLVQAGQAAGDFGGGGHSFRVNASEATNLFSIGVSSSGPISGLFDTVGANLYNVANAALRCGRNTVTLRSINAGGTVNASGADYAEYMRKAANCGVIAKGQIVGITAAGEITDKWADAIAFMVKSTDPSYVGGDVWGTEEIIGKRPAELRRKEDVIDLRMVSPAIPATADAPAVDAVYAMVLIEAGDTDHEWAQKQTVHAAEMDAFNTVMEAARQAVDRIAFAGQVPVNVMGSTPGHHIVPVQSGDGIAGVSIANPTFEQYMASVGKVIAIEADGRAKIIVKAA